MLLFDYTPLTVPLAMPLALALQAAAPPPSEPLPAAPRLSVSSSVPVVSSLAPPRRPAMPRPVAVFAAAGGSVRVELEVAATAAERARGLMYRRRLAADAGMLFLFPDAQLRTFWMRDTYLSLDILFIGPQRRVVGLVVAAEPLSEAPRGVGVPSKYVIEVTAGFAAAHGIGVGTPVSWTGLGEVQVTP